jgi:hypothetical protein
VSAGHFAKTQIATVSAAVHRSSCRVHLKTMEDLLAVLEQVKSDTEGLSAAFAKLLAHNVAVCGLVDAMSSVRLERL